MKYYGKKNGKSRKAKAAKRNLINGNISNKGMNQQEKVSKNDEPIEESPEEKIVRKAYELAPEWKISQSAKRRFMSLPSSFQTSEGKEACIKEALAAHKEWIPDPTRYWIWLIDETEKLIRVWDFKDTCKDAGVNPLTVAQHLILEGKMVCNAIRMEGLKAYGSKIRMFVDPLFEDEFHIFGGAKMEAAHE